MTDGKVQITVKNTQTDISDEPMEAAYLGSYRQLAGKHLITYEEYFGEEGANPVKNTNLMKIEKSSVQITKKGAVTTKMCFEAGRRHIGSYQTPFGNFHMQIDTERLAVKETSQAVRVDIVYHLSLNGSAVSQCIIQLEIKNETSSSR